MQRGSGLRSALAAAAAAIFSLAARPALGQTCSASATGIAFGIYQPLAASPVTSTATVTITCSSPLSLLVSYSIQLGPGGGGSYAARSMGGSGGRLAYQLYTGALYNQVWGAGTAGTTAVANGYLLGVVLPTVSEYTVYGRIAAGNNVGVGTYGDTITVVVIY